MSRFNLLFAASSLALAAGSAGFAQAPMQAPEGSPITVTGEVTFATASTFRLDYGDGIVSVEMDDYDFDADAAPLEIGDDVTVYGFIDDGFFEARTIEASTVYVEDNNTFFYASGADEEADYAFYSIPIYNGADLAVSGVVESIDGREFVLDQGVGNVIEVDTANLAYNPLDDEGLQQIDVGDRVSVTGEIDDDLFDNAELSADTVMILTDISQDSG